MKTESEIVARQYETWSYPKPESDLAVYTQAGSYDFSDPSLFRRKLWPKKVEPENLEILIAGCGTIQAATYAYKNPGCHVTAVDISEPSLGHEKYLKQKHNLENLDLYLMSLGEVASLRKSYDLIVSTGVLHHLPDPDAGLRVLRDVLRPHGVMSLMLYGYYRRFGVYMMQEAFRLAKLEQDEYGVSLVKQAVAALPPWHHVKTYISGAPDLEYDAGFVDTFLHRQDRAYTVPQVLAFATENGLKFQCWLDNLNYSVAAAFSVGHPLRDIAYALPKEDQWHMVELVAQSLGCHRFLLCHPNRPASDYTLDFSINAETAAWMEYIPTVRPPIVVLEPANLDSDTPARLKRDWQTFELSPLEAQMMMQVDGQKTIRMIVEMQPWLKKDLSQRLALAQAFFARMADLDHLQFELSSVS
jgi:SAM-dependent methyltransferase